MTLAQACAQIKPKSHCPNVYPDYFLNMFIDGYQHSLEWCYLNVFATGYKVGFVFAIL